MVYFRDFNCILHSNDSSEGNINWSSYQQDFKDCITTSHLGDVKYVGEVFTWFNKRPQDPIYRKLDRILCNDKWFSEFPEAQGLIMNRSIMDHNPIILSIPVQVEVIRKCFQFFNYMLEWEGFKDMIATVWASPLYGNPMAILCRKLQLVKTKIKEINRNSGNVHANVVAARAELQVIQKDLAGNPVNSNLLVKEAEAVSTLNKALDNEEKFLMQKSRVQWLKLGDGNNSYFYNQIKANWNRNKILSIKNSEGDLVQGHENISQVAVDYFQKSLGVAQTSSNIDLSEIQVTKVSPSQARFLLSPITNELIFSTLKSMKKNKAPGPDGFTVNFFIHCWDIIGGDFCEAVLHFFNSGQMHKGVNSTLISLLPKQENPSSMKDFRPISLCTVVYKCISKILASRLKLILPNLIDKSQSAFVKGRIITDNIMLAHDLFRGYDRKGGKARCAIKVDLHKAFDSVNWDFLMAVLMHMEFPGQFINWIKACICNPMFSVKINGASKGYFAGAKGIRQGDPLSPYLFTMIMNILSNILNNAPGFFKFHWKCRDLKINHLFFADDVLLFSHGDRNSIMHLMNSLSKFGSLSGLNPSMSKSTCFLSNCDPQLMSWFNAEFGIPMGLLPVKFLGVPLLSSKLSIKDCRPLFEKISARIESWTNHVLSIMGRTQLIKGVLSAITGFWTKHFMLPLCVLKKIQSCMANFLWKGSAHKISWSTACLPIAEGGLGFKDLIEWNKAQLIFQICRIITNHDSIWTCWVNKTVLKKKNFWAISIPADCSWVWRNILKLRKIAMPFISYCIGNGKGINFWLDPWYQGNCLANYATRAIISESNSHDKVTIHNCISYGSWFLPIFGLHSVMNEWRNNFISPAFDLTKEDVVLWNGTAAKKVKSGDIWDSIRASSQPVNWATGVWFKEGVKRHIFTSWLLCHGRLNTADRLLGFGMTVDSNCCFCAGGQESAQHLFLFCPYSQYITDRLFSQNMGIFIDIGRPWNQFLVHLQTIQQRDKRYTALILAQSYAYFIWKERNARLHDGLFHHPKKLLQEILISARARISSIKWLYSPQILIWLSL